MPRSTSLLPQTDNQNAIQAVKLASQSQRRKSRTQDSASALSQIIAIGVRGGHSCGESAGHRRVLQQRTVELKMEPWSPLQRAVRGVAPTVNGLS